MEQEGDSSFYALPDTMYLNAAASWIRNADRVLICAGAGMSVKKGTNVYVDEEDFKKYYPWMPAYGITKAYQTMGGLWDNPRIPKSVAWAFHASHMMNQRYAIPPHEGYEALFNLVKAKDHFVWTSNVDGCFVRSGFSKDRIYTPQGDWQYFQCSKPCSKQVWDSKPILDSVLPFIKDGKMDESKFPRCPNCGEFLHGNVRGGEWFVHDHYNSIQDRMIEWLRETESKGLKLAIIEIGAGFNTPVVTRFPMESITRSFRGAKLIRVNPTEPEFPLDISAVGIKKGWQIFEELSKAEQLAKDESDVEKERETILDYVKKSTPNADLKQGVPFNFHWAILKNLRR